MGDQRLKKEDICVCRRDGNKKRNFVLVNKVQGKHYPCSPSDIREAADSLVGKADVHGEKITIIAFAETATALWCLVAETLARENDVFLVTTTREEVFGSVVQFEEEHSHATQQKLVIDGLREVSPSCSRIILLDDEVSTEKTNLNVIEKLEKIGITAGKRVEVWSYVNSMNSDEVSVYEEKGIHLVFLLKLTRADLKSEADKVMPFTYIPKCTGVKQPVITKAKMPFHYDSVMNGVQATDFIIDLHKKIESFPFPEYDSVDVIGVEECMYPAICVAEYLECRGANVTCHSTTRSPICANSSVCLEKRITLPSVHEKDRVNYLYNLGVSPDVVLVTNEKNDRLLSSLVNRIAKYHAIESIFVISLNGD